LNGIPLHEAAEELGMEVTALRKVLTDMGLPVRSHMTPVKREVIGRVRVRVERQKRGITTAPTAPPPPTKRRRRRRVRPKPIQPDVEATAEEAAPAAGPPGTAEAPADTPEADPAPVAAEAVAVAEPPAEPVTAPATAPDAPAPADQADEAAAAPEEEAAAPAPDKDPGKVRAKPATPRKAADGVSAGPRRVRRDPTPPKPAPVPKATASPGGDVRISASGYAAEGQKKRRRGGRRGGRVSQRDVATNVKATLAKMVGGKPTRSKGPPKQEQVETPQQEEQAEVAKITVAEFLTVAELARLMGTTPQQIIRTALKDLGLMVTINQRLDFDQIEVICADAGFEAVRYDSGMDEADNAAGDAESSDDMRPRPPVVTVMGHVDHGKTSILDRIRRSNVIAGEAGGITQHIGAYHVKLESGDSVTFLDTPGHEAFTAMRARGATVTDIVVLVVAADDSVMPQTREAISHAQASGVPIVVAINKVDVPAADSQRVKSDLLGAGVVLEEFGGEILSAEVSAKTGQGIDDLLEKIGLQSELMQLTANPNREARGVVVEAELDPGKGAMATVLVQAGTLRVGDTFVCGLHDGRVRALLDERGRRVKSVKPGMPARVLGISGVPESSDSITVMAPSRVRDVLASKQRFDRDQGFAQAPSGNTLEELFSRVSRGEQGRLNIVIKGDADGSVQAVSDTLERLSTDEVSVHVVHRAVGGINKSDILLAATVGAVVIGFHVRPDASARAEARRHGVEIRTYKVIYEVAAEIREALEGLLTPDEKEVTVGSAEVRALFKVPRAGTVAGCYVQDGVIQRRLPVRLVRDQIPVYEGRIGSLRRFTEDVREVRDGYECGISIENFNDVKVGDVIECYEVVEVARKLEREPA